MSALEAGWHRLLEGRFWLAIWHEINEDDCWGMAAQLSYYFLLAFFPFLLFLSSLLAFLPGMPDLLHLLLAGFSRFLPDAPYQLVKGIVESLLAARHGGLLTFGLVTALWFASAAFNSMIGLLNRTFQAPEYRSYYQTRFLAILVTIVVSIFTVFSGVLLFFGDWVIDRWIQEPWLNELYSGFRWLLIFLFLNIGVQIVFHFLPAVRLPWRFFSPGGVLATAGWVLGSLLFRGYVNHYANFRLLWGPLGALIALMAWFYLCSFSLLLGAEVDAEIYKRSRLRYIYAREVE